MISILNSSSVIFLRWIAIAVVMVSLFGLPQLTHAQNSQSISISPTLFNLSANPGQTWRSQIRVINPNNYPLPIYTEAVNFSPVGDDGIAQFTPIEQTAEIQTFAEWVTLPQERITVPAGGVREIPVIVNVPPDAPPGGHYAAVLIGTQPLNEDRDRPSVETSQIVSTLLFLRVAGDIVEAGEIREFSVANGVVGRPEAEFSLRFANLGNVHIQPQGTIRIENMWGQERGVIPVNQETMFGNTLPEQIRRYQFRWEGEWSLADIGRYQAIATLAYGSNERQFSDAAVTFWFIPWRWLLGVLAVIAGIIWVIVLLIRRYVASMLKLAGVDPAEIQAQRSTARQRAIRERVSVFAPIESGMLDLRTRLRTAHSIGGILTELLRFVRYYRWFFFGIIVVIIATALATWYVLSARVAERGYSVSIEHRGQMVELNSEDVRYRELQQTGRDSVTATEDVRISNAPELVVINRSGVTGTGARARIMLESLGYEVASLEADLQRTERNTVIVYNAAYADTALLLSEQLGDALVSEFNSDDNTDPPIVISLGQDQLE